MESIKVRYYGVISEIFMKNEEQVSISPNTSINELITQYYSPRFSDTNPIHSIAINNNIIHGDVIIKNGDVIDLMPAFAGG